MDAERFYRDARRDLPGPLAGVRVLEATTTWAGPMCGCLLADYGADVVKLEHPDGEIARRSPPTLPGVDPPLSFMHATVNRNKRSLALDLHSTEAHEVFLRLVERSDVVIENFRPGTLDAWGLGYEGCRARRADIVYASISGYGQYGPEHERIGYDPLAQAESGFLSLNGSPDGDPVKSPTFLGDDLAGVHAALAVLAALRHRDVTGEGQHIDVSLLDSLLFQSSGYLTLGALGVELPRLGNEFRIAAPANTYVCRDGRIMAGVLLDSHWKRLAPVLGHPEAAEDPAYANAPERIARREEVDRWVAEWAASRSVDEALAELRAADVPAAPVRTYAESSQTDHVRERGTLQDVVQTGGQCVPIVAAPARFGRTPVEVRSGAPALGEHAAEILEELGYDADARAALEEAGVTRRRER